jgi:hypothetical protein
MSAWSAWPVFDVAEMAQEASEQAGVEFRSGYSLRTARRSLELLSIEWANRGLNLWTIEGPDTIDLLANEPDYSLPGDTVDLVEHSIRTISADGQFTELPIERMTLPEYAAITNKRAAGRPSILNMRRQINPYFSVWMVPPDDVTYQLVYWRLRRMQSVGAGGGGQPEIPWRFIPAMISGLAYYLALKSKDPQALQRAPILKAAYEEQFMLASDEDRDRAAFRFVPGGYERIGA